MNKLAKTCFLIVLATVLKSHAQSVEDLSKAVVFLRHDFIETSSNENGTYEVWLKLPNTNSFIPKLSSVCGTGFLIAWSNDLFLVTARHVAYQMSFSDRDLIIIGAEGGKSFPIPLPMLRGANTNSWLHHIGADVSVLPLDPPPQLYQTLLARHFLNSSFLEAGTNRPRRDLVLTIVGFPLGMGWGQNGDDFIPFVRKTRAASGFIDSGNAFVLEDPSVQGYSGSPVLDLVEPISGSSGTTFESRPMACYGVVSGTLGDDTGGKMAVVISTKCVVELIDDYEKSIHKH